jgi:hypothetical protein
MNQGNERAPDWNSTASPNGSFDGPSDPSNTGTSTRARFEDAREAAQRQVEEVRAQADFVKEHAVERIRRVGSALRTAGDGLGDDEALADYARKASERLDGFASYLSTADGKRLVRDTEELARQKPALFFGGAFLLGLAAGRFLKSSRPEPDHEPGQHAADTATDYTPPRAGASP